MNRDMLLDAIGKIDDTYIAAAQDRAALLSTRSSASKASTAGIIRLRSLPHRAALTAAAIVLLLLSSFTAAMAANEDFRNAVFRFFRISTPEVVLPLEEEPAPSDATSPGASGDTGNGEDTNIAEIENLGNTDIEDAVAVEYLRIDGIFDYCDGAIYLYEPWEGYDDTYDAQVRYAAAAYVVENGQMVPLEPHYETISFTWDNVTRTVEPLANETIYNNTSGDALSDNGTADNETMDGETPDDGSLENGTTDSGILDGEASVGGPLDNETTDSETPDDGTYQISFDWYEKDGTLYTNAKNYDPFSSMEWSVSAVAGNPDFLILNLGFGQQIEYTQYPLLYNVRTKELLDVLARCRLPEGQQITRTDFSPNLSKMLITCDYDATVYYYDIETENLVSLNELSGLDEPEASFLDNYTVSCLSIDENGLYYCRTLSMPSGECTECFSGLPRLTDDSHSGIALTGGRYGLYVDEESNAFVYDFKVGESAPVTDFKYPKDDVFLTMNSAEDKILFIQETSETDGLGISQIGVLDLASRTFVLFDREGYETRRETSIGWFDHDSVAIRADVDGCGYLYLYTVENSF